MPEAHLTRERLLALLDGESGLWGRWRAERHLRACWRCRGQMEELREQIRDLQREIREPGWPTATDVAKSRWHWRASVAEWEASVRDRPQVLWPKAAAVLSMVGCAVLAAWFLTPGPRTAPATPQFTLKPLLAAEEAAVKAPALHEELTVEIESSGHGKRIRSWDRYVSGDRTRFSSRWKDEAGRLRHAVFAPTPNRKERFTPGSGLSRLGAVPDRVPLTGIDLAPATPLDGAESRLLSWVESLGGMPVSFAAEMAGLESSRKARISTPDGLHWTAETDLGRTRLSFQLAAQDSNTAPATASLRWRVGEEYVEVRFLLARRVRLARAADVSHFLEPDRDLLARPAEPPAPVDSKDLRSLDTELLAAEAEAVVALHAAGLAQSGELVVRRKGSRVVVCGAVMNAELAEQVDEVLAELSGRELLVVQLLTPEALSAEGKPLAARGADESAGSASSALETHLRQTLKVGPQLPERELFQRMTALTRAAEQLSADSWTAQRLLAQFPEARRALLPVRIRGEIDRLLVESGERINGSAASLARQMERLGFSSSADAPVSGGVPELAAAGRRLSEGVLALASERDPRPEVGERMRLLAGEARRIAMRGNH